jgi:hypothetical protein
MALSATIIIINKEDDDVNGNINVNSDPLSAAAGSARMTMTVESDNKGGRGGSVGCHLQGAEAPGVGYAQLTKPCQWRGKRLHHDGDVCVLVFASKKPSVVFCSHQNRLSCKAVNRMSYWIFSPYKVQLKG